MDVIRSRKREPASPPAIPFAPAPHRGRGVPYMISRTLLMSARYAWRTHDSDEHRLRSSKNRLPLSSSDARCEAFARCIASLQSDALARSRAARLALVQTDFSAQ